MVAPCSLNTLFSNSKSFKHSTEIWLSTLLQLFTVLEHFFKKTTKSYYFNSLGHKWLTSPVVGKGHNLFHNQPNIAQPEVAAFGGHQAAFSGQAKDSPRLGNVKEQAELESRLKQVNSLDSLCCHKRPKSSLSWILLTLIKQQFSFDF